MSSPESLRSTKPEIIDKKPTADMPSSDPLYSAIRTEDFTELKLLEPVRISD